MNFRCPCGLACSFTLLVKKKFHYLLMLYLKLKASFWPWFMSRSNLLCFGLFILKAYKGFILYSKHIQVGLLLFWSNSLHLILLRSFSCNSTYSRFVQVWWYLGPQAPGWIIYIHILKHLQKICFQIVIVLSVFVVF